MKMRFKIYDLKFKNYPSTLRQLADCSGNNFSLRERSDSKGSNITGQFRRGFTLIELLLYMGIFSTLLMVFVQLFGTIVTVNLESQATGAVSQDGRYILNQMTYTLRQASTYTTPSLYGSANQTNSLTFTTQDGTTYTYQLVNDTVDATKKDLQITDGSGNYRLNSYGTTVSNLSFTKLHTTTSTKTTTTITVSFTLTSTTKDQKGNQQETFSTTIGGRK